MINQDLIPEIDDNLIDEMRRKLPGAELWEIGALLTSVGTYLLMAVRQDTRQRLIGAHNFSNSILRETSPPPTDL